MASIEREIKQKKFSHEQLKANVNILFTANWLNNQITALLKPHNLTHEQFNVLRILRGKHPGSLRQKDILERMIARQSNVTLIIKKLKTKDFVQVVPSEKDRREHVISITEEGLKVLADIDNNTYEKILNTNQLNDKDATTLSLLLDKLRGD